MKRKGNPSFKPVKRMVNGRARTYYVRALPETVSFGYAERLIDTTVRETVDMDLVQRNIEEGFISANEWQGLTILNYTKQAQFDNEWNPATIICRGLIVDKEWNIVARPFAKFFNLAQHSDQTRFLGAPFTAHEKMDGSLGIIFRHPDTGELRVATRGSFTSDQALWATNWINQNDLVDFDDSVTPLVEVIYPENRIVVDYGEDKKLVFLDAIENETGNDSPESMFEWRGERARSFHEVSDLEELISGNGPLADDGNNEGYVLKFNVGGKIERVKVKLDEYVRLHKIVTGINSKHIWERLATGGNFDDIIDRVPDEFYEWVKETQANLNNAYKEIREEAESNYSKVIRELDSDFSKKDFALAVQNMPNKHLLFSKLQGDDKKIDTAIWKSLKPLAEKPFASEG